MVTMQEKKKILTNGEHRQSYIIITNKKFFVPLEQTRGHSCVRANRYSTRQAKSSSLPSSDNSN